MCPERVVRRTPEGGTRTTSQYGQNHSLRSVESRNGSQGGRFGASIPAETVEPELLKRTINRSCTLRDLLENEALGLIVSQTESLPSLPDLYCKLMEEIRASDGSIRRVGDNIETDLSMSAKVVQLVSSAFFGLPRKVSSPSEAVMLLGLDTVKALALTMGYFRCLMNPLCLHSHQKDL